VNVGLHVQDSDAFVDPGPAKVSKLYLQFRYLADPFKIGWAAVTALLAIHEDANMKYYIHTEASDFLIERDDLRVIRVPVSGNHLDTAQAKLVVAALHFFDHKTNCVFERAMSQLRDRIQNAETVKTLRRLATYVSAIVVVGANVIKMLSRKFRGVNIEQGRKNEGDIHITRVQAGYYSVSAFSGF
jgi:hypothetical protein